MAVEVHGGGLWPTTCLHLHRHYLTPSLVLPAVGKPVYDERGELVCVKPFPSMPIYFWKDEEGAKYKKAYFSTFPGKDHTGGRLFDCR